MSANLSKNQSLILTGARVDFVSYPQAITGTISSSYLIEGIKFVKVSRKTLYNFSWNQLSPFLLHSRSPPNYLLNIL